MRTLVPRLLFISLMLLISLGSCRRTDCGAGTVRRGNECVAASISLPNPTHAEGAPLLLPQRDRYLLDHYGTYLRVAGDVLVELQERYRDIDMRGICMRGVTPSTGTPAANVPVEIVVYDPRSCLAPEELGLHRVELSYGLNGYRGACVTGLFRLSTRQVHVGPVVGHPGMCRMWADLPFRPGTFMVSRGPFNRYLIRAGEGTP